MRLLLNQKYFLTYQTYAASIFVISRLVWLRTELNQIFLSTVARRDERARLPSRIQLGDEWRQMRDRLSG